MTASRFIIPSLLAAGFGTPHPDQVALTHAAATGTDDPSAGTLLRIFTQDHRVTLAQHRSHRSHSSHSSHVSHRSGGGHYSHTSHTSHRSSTGGYPVPTYPAPTNPTPSPPSPRPPSPSYPAPSRDRATPPTGTAPLPALSGRSERFAAIVRRVQIALMAQGYYHGAIDGIVGPATRSALRQFQAARNLTVTGTITPETLDALRISSE